MVEDSIKIITEGSLNIAVKGISWEMIKNTDVLISVLSSIKPLEKEPDNIRGKSLRVKYNKGEVFSFVPSDGYVISLLSKIINRLEITSFLDLGCGPGISLKALYETMDFYFPQVNKNLKLGGIEYNEKYIKVSKIILNSKISKKSGFKNGIIKKGDITKIRRQSIKNFECLYAYEPLVSRNHCESFAKNLYKIMDKTQIFILKYSGNMYEYLLNEFDETERFQMGELYLFWKNK